MDKLKMQSPNLVEANVDKIAAFFPNCITESRDENGIVRRAIDFDLLRQELSTIIVEGPQERYQLNWPGKREALLTANAPIAKTLRPCREESVDFENTKNIFIEGDNLDALKLLQETYLGKIKMIYFDPPYNTGNDFLYEDDFAEDIESFKIRSNQKDEVGNRLISNNESNGRFHSDWLSMMYSRLKLASNLLIDDGVIFISIDDNEVHNLRKICNEVFGENNFICCFIWNSKTTGGHDSKDANIVHEYILCFGNNTEKRGSFIKLIDSGTEYPLNDPESGKTFKWDSLWTVSHGYTENCDYPIPAPDGSNVWPWMCHKDGEKVKKRARWFWSKETYEAQKKELLVKKTDVGWKVYKKVFGGSGIPIQTIINRDMVGGTSEGKAAVEELFGQAGVFENPKPPRLIKSFIERMPLDAIILDFFAGSGTTAQATMEQNATDGGNRQFIMVQLPEPCDEKSEAYKAGYKTIAEIGKERIRRAGKKIKEEWEEKNRQGVLVEGMQQSLDIGFRVFKVDTSNMKDVYYTPDALKQENLELFKDHIKPERTPEDLLFQVFIDWGLDLSLPIAAETIDKKTVFIVDKDALVACFDKGITEEFVKKLAGYKPVRVVFRDDAFANDAVKINVEQIFKLLSPKTEVKAI